MPVRFSTLDGAGPGRRSRCGRLPRCGVGQVDDGVAGHRPVGASTGASPALRWPAAGSLSIGGVPPVLSERTHAGSQLVVGPIRWPGDVPGNDGPRLYTGIYVWAEKSAS